MKNITQQKLADLANVSVSTVSKAFADSSEISEKTKNRIFELAKELGCFSKYYNQTPDSKVIGIIANEIKENDYTECLKHLDKRIRNDGNIMLVTYTNYSLQTKKYLADYFSGFAKVDGLIVFSSAKEINLSNPDLPVVEFGGSYEPSIRQNCDRILSDSSTLAHDAVSYLVQNGHTEIAYIGEILTKIKETAFLKAMKSHGLTPPPEHIRTSRVRFEEAGYSEMAEILTLQKRPTAIFCAYDTIAHGVISCIKDRGFSVPDDFSVISIDGIGSSAIGYNLTTYQKYDTPHYDMAYELLMKKIDNPYLPKQTIMTSPRFLERGTVKNIKE